MLVAHDLFISCKKMVDGNDDGMVDSNFCRDTFDSSHVLPLSLCIADRGAVLIGN